MLNTTRNHSTQAAGLKNALAAILLCGSGAASAADIHLCAITGTATLPPANAPTTVPVLGYAIGTATSCPASVTAPGGPDLTVVAGDNIILHNGLGEATGLLFPGLGLIPDTTGISNTPAGQTKSYTIPAVSPGTYLYQAAPLTNAEHQVAMGLYGALIVRAPDVPQRPTSATTVAGSADVLDTGAVATDVGLKVSGPGVAAGTTVISVVPGTSFTLSAPAVADGAVSLSKGSAYGGAATMYDEEAVLVLSEIDPALNGRTANCTPAQPTAQACFDMRSFAPKYFLINGKAYPDTAPIISAAGHTLLLRYVNAGAKHHSIGALGLRQNFIAKDGSQLPSAAVSVAAETLASGQTADALITIPATATGKFAVYDASLQLHNGSAPGFGGMMTFVNSGAGAAASGPSTSDVTATPNPANGTVDVALAANLKASTSSTVDGAEYFIDTKGADGAGVAMTGTFGAGAAAVNAAIPAATLTSLPSGKHTIFVHGHDTSGTPGTGTWGGYSFVVLNLDRSGPVSSALTLSPNPSNGTTAVALSATLSDAATGGLNVTNAEYFIGTPGADGTGIAMTLGGAAAPVRSATASISAATVGALSVGANTIQVHGRDQLGNWGALSTVTLTVTKGGPTTSKVTLAQNPNNGSYTLSSGQAVLRVTASFNGGASVVTSGEAFIDNSPADTVRGFVFVPSDGAWNATTETGYADIPIANIGALSSGTHTVYVRGKDSTGAWGATASAALLIDRNAPVLTSGSLAISTIAYGTPSVTLNFSATDSGGAGVAGVQYWIDGSATAPANPPTAAGAASVTINTSTLAGGAHTLYYRARDAANNVSTTVLSAPLTVVQAVNDVRSITANTSASQSVNFGASNGLLSNDLPVNPARAAAIASVPARISGAGSGTITITCQGGTGNVAATPAISGNTVCTNGAFRVTLSGVGSLGSARQASKLGAYKFDYTLTLNGVSSTAIATINVN